MIDCWGCLGIAWLLFWFVGDFSLCGFYVFTWLIGFAGCLDLL